MIRKQESQGKWGTQHPLLYGRLRENVIGQQRGGLRHTTGAAGRAWRPRQNPRRLRLKPTNFALRHSKTEFLIFMKTEAIV